MKSFKDVLQAQHLRGKVGRATKNLLTLTKRKKNKVDPKASHGYFVSELNKPKRIPKWYDPVVECMTIFCNTTGISGVPFITRDDAPTVDRIAWFVIVTISIIVGAVLLIICWQWNALTPTRQNIDSSQAPAYLIRFPAVTICNLNRISKKRATELATNFTDLAQNITTQDVLKLFRLTMYAKAGLTNPQEDYLKLHTILRNNRFTLEQLTSYLTPTCEELIKRCNWKGETVKCDAMFQAVTTSEGLCCAFNYFGKNESNFPAKVIARGETAKAPYKVSSCGSKSGLHVLIDPDNDDYFATYISAHGIKLFIHDSYDYPDENAAVIYISASREAYVPIQPKSTFATDTVRSLKTSIRNCYFYDENKLAIMQRYSMNNCFTECRSKLIYELCDCVSDTLVRNKTMKLCELNQVQCILQNAAHNIASALPGFNSSLLSNESYVRPKEKPCGCLPACEINQYAPDSYSTLLDRNFSSSYRPIFKNIEIKNHIFLHVFFTDLFATRYILTTSQTWLEVLASFGGLLGFVMGFSIISIMELIFALMFRPILNHFKI